MSFEITNCFQVAVYRRSFMKKSVKLACHVVIQTSFLVLCDTQISGRMYNTDGSIKCIWCEKCFAARHYADIGKQFLFANNRNRVRGAVLCLLQDGACTGFFFLNLSVNSLKGDLLNATTFKPHIFSLVNAFKIGYQYLLLYLPTLSGQWEDERHKKETKIISMVMFG